MASKASDVDRQIAEQQLAQRRSMLLPADDSLFRTSTDSAAESSHHRTGAAKQRHTPLCRGRAESSVLPDASPARLIVREMRCAAVLADYVLGLVALPMVVARSLTPHAHNPGYGPLVEGLSS